MGTLVRSNGGASAEPWRRTPAFTALLSAFLGDLRQTLGAELVGAYLYGSAVAGEFEPSFSDLDVVVVMARSTDELDFEVLGGVVSRLAAREPDWAERLDLAFVGRPTLASFRQGGPLVSISHNLPLQRYDEAEAWLQTWYLVREASTPLLGPPVAEVIPPIGRDDFVAAVTSDSDRLIRRALDPETDDRVLAYTILTLARVRRVAKTGEIVPKDEAGRWLADRMPDWRDVIETAIRVRHRSGTADAAWRDRARDLATRIVPPAAP